MAPCPSGWFRRGLTAALSPDERFAQREHELTVKTSELPARHQTIPNPPAEQRKASGSRGGNEPLVDATEGGEIRQDAISIPPQSSCRRRRCRGLRRCRRLNWRRKRRHFNHLM